MKVEETKKEEVQKVSDLKPLRVPISAENKKQSNDSARLKSEPILVEEQKYFSLNGIMC